MVDKYIGFINRKHNDTLTQVKKYRTTTQTNAAGL